jgi:hypothetical protein
MLDAFFFFAELSGEVWSSVSVRTNLSHPISKILPLPFGGGGWNPPEDIWCRKKFVGRASILG